MAAIRLRALDGYEALADAELVQAGRAGDDGALSELYRRHAPAAHRVARGVAASRDDAADAVAEAFTQVFATLSAGRAPDMDFRPYLLAATRHAAVDQLRRAARTHPAGDAGTLDRPSAGHSPPERVVATEDSDLVARAFRDLPERWRSVLWLTDVERVPAREAAGVLGLSANNVSQLAVRARARLRSQYLQAHVRNHAPPACQPTLDRLGAYLADTLTARQRARVEDHLAGCPGCRARRTEVEELGPTLRRAAPALPAVVVAFLARRSPAPTTTASAIVRPRARWPWSGSSGDDAPSPRPTDAGPAGVAGGATEGGSKVLSRAVGSVPGSVSAAVSSPLAATVATSPVTAMAAAIGARAVARSLVAAGAAMASLVAASPQHAAPPRLAAPGPVEVSVPTTQVDVAAAAPGPPPTTTLPLPPPAAPNGLVGPPPVTHHPRSVVARAVVPNVYVFPSPGADIADLSFDSPQASGQPAIFLVLEQRGDWIHVQLPIRPNGSSGWVRRSDVSLSVHNFSIVVELAAHRITAFQGTKPFLDEPIGVGTANTPTPGGLFFTEDLVRPVDGRGRVVTDGPYGPYILALSAHSEVLTSFAGGDAVIGLHGTNDPSALGHSVSHGCIRLSNAAITTLATTMPLGVPVEIR